MFKSPIKTILAALAVIALVLFGLWFLVLEGPAPSLAPR